MHYPNLLAPLTVGQTTLKNRIIMAPLTRLRAVEPGDVPGPLAAEYYAQRADAGLIITEATQISYQAKGYAGAPGLHTDAQQAAWTKIVDAVHAQGGKIAVQLWHTGLVSHQSLQPHGLPPISASAVTGLHVRTSLRDEHGHTIRAKATPPRAAELSDIHSVITDYAAATRRAREAGFDFIEIHAAHGYLLSQFWAEAINHRTDEYGGSRDHRARLILDVIDACISAWDKNHIGIRISPLGAFNGVDFGYHEDDSIWLVEQINQRGIAYLHISEPDWAGGQPLHHDFRQRLRAAFNHTIITAGGYTPEKAAAVVTAGDADAVAFGRAFIGNPDLVTRIAEDAPINGFNEATCYGGAAQGYTDYPTWQQEHSAR